MKCIKSIRKTKDVEVGEIKRVDNKTADSMVGSTWTYIPKSEWKSLTRRTKSEVVQKEVDSKQETTDKKPYKKGTKSETHKNKK